MDIEVDTLQKEEAGDRDGIVSTQETTDPVIYQLVRVDGDGRFIPATDDEVIAVEDLCQDDKNKGVSQPEGSLEVGPGKLNEPPKPKGNSECDIQIKEGVPSSVPCTTSDTVHQSISPEEKPKLPGALDESDTSNSSSKTSLKPDFSLLKGEIHLDDLSVRDLQETFKATFGRETSVKDKQWLKRRIIMGLTNSCDFSVSTLIMTDNRVVNTVRKETFEATDCSDLVDCPVRSEVEKNETLSIFHGKREEIHSNENELPSPNLEGDYGSNDADTEQRQSKRVRKPTKRYIEELSEGESKNSEAKSITSVKNPAHDQPLKVGAKPLQNVGLHGSCLIRKVSLGGSGVQVPYASRIRRSRPRENFVTLMPTVSLERDTLFTERKTAQLERRAKLENTSPNDNTWDDDDVASPKSNGGMRRNHHRPWTLTEVVKLVEGVAKYGVGRWSEIKRLSFASYSYRTSVDLKDKWRNLLKASLADPPSGNEMQVSRRQTSASIPTQILSRVRELADVQSVIRSNLGSTKLSGQDNCNRTVDEAQPGFL